MEAETQRPKILVVDDTAENRALAQATLEDEDYQVVQASSGEEALALFERERPDCVLLDVRMPGMDGLTVCQRIRAMDNGAETPVVFLTALRDVDTFDQALKAGGDDFLTKPVRPTELLVRVQAALKLRRMSTELREHYDLVRHQRDDLMRLQLQKERLTAFVVHDLKNPVNAMDLHAQLLLREPNLAPRVHESLQEIREEVRSLLRLVLNLLDISKSEEGQLAPRKAEVNLSELSQTVLDAMQVKAKAGAVTLASEIAVERVVADPDLLRRILENLLDNALRHAPENSTVRLSAVPRDNTVEIRVQDEGPGVSEDMREKIFERFVQIESGARIVTRTGRGLGLAFCKLAVEAHGGRIWIEDAQPGAVFCFDLPKSNP